MKKTTTSEISFDFDLSVLVIDDIEITFDCIESLCEYIKENQGTKKHIHDFTIEN